MCHHNLRRHLLQDVGVDTIRTSQHTSALCPRRNARVILHPSLTPPSTSRMNLPHMRGRRERHHPLLTRYSGNPGSMEMAHGEQTTTVQWPCTTILPIGRAVGGQATGGTQTRHCRNVRLHTMHARTRTLTPHDASAVSPLPAAGLPNRVCRTVCALCARSSARRRGDGSWTAGSA